MTTDHSENDVSKSAEPDGTIATDQGMTTDIPGIVAQLGELGSGAVITEEALGRLFSRHPTSVKRAVERSELPPPCRLFGQNTWTVGVLVAHIERRLAQAAREVEQMETKIRQLSP